MGACGFVGLLVDLHAVRQPPGDLLPSLVRLVTPWSQRSVNLATVLARRSCPNASAGQSMSRTRFLAIELIVSLTPFDALAKAERSTRNPSPIRCPSSAQPQCTADLNQPLNRDGTDCVEVPTDGGYLIGEKRSSPLSHDHPPGPVVLLRQLTPSGDRPPRPALVGVRPGVRVRRGVWLRFRGPGGP
jgi:hypothetical protein